MADQNSLYFGGLTIADTSNGADGYIMQDSRAGSVDYVDKAIPGSRGRILFAVGSWQSDQTAPSLAFSGQSLFEDGDSVASFLADVTRYQSDPHLCVQTVGYGYGNVGGGTMQNAKMEFSAREVWLCSDGVFLEWDARFTQMME